MHSSKGISRVSKGYNENKKRENQKVKENLRDLVRALVNSTRPPECGLGLPKWYRSIKHALVYALVERTRPPEL